MRRFVILEGEGPTSVLATTGDFHCIAYRGWFDSMIRDTAIRNLQLRGLGPKSPNGALISMMFVVNCRIEGCLFVDAGHDAWHALRNCSRICVEGNTVLGAYDDGLNPGGSALGLGTHDVLIRGNHIESVEHDGIHLSVNAHDITVVENTIVNCGNGVGLFNSRDSLIEANTISDCQGGIRTVAGPNDGMRLIANEIDRIAEEAIAVEGASVIVSRNVVRDVWLGVLLDSAGGLVSENTLERCEIAAIGVVGGSERESVRILDNTILTVILGGGILVDARCAVVARNVVRETMLYSIWDVRRYSRVILNDVDGPIAVTPGDANCDERIDFGDILAVVAAWGLCPGAVEDCGADLDGDAAVTQADLLLVLANWGR